MDGSGVSSASYPACAVPEAFVGVEAGFVAGGADRFVGLVEPGCGRESCCVLVNVADGDLVQQEQPFNGAAAVFDRHAAVVSEQVSDLAVQALQA